MILLPCSSLYPGAGYDGHLFTNLQIKNVCFQKTLNIATCLGKIWVAIAENALGSVEIALVFEILNVPYL